ncbi:hypothetical protein ACFVTF_15235 [Kitasatospora sp. NPDC057940]|uniref:hypothetical protein n=1 Tax=Kitasatospora sp. NPDC057940 TaxID=3346285 RepID=UPI0036D75AF7
MRSGTRGVREYWQGDELSDDEYVLVLYRVAVKARTGRTAGPAPRPGPLESYADDGALDAAVRRLGPRALPVLARFDPDTEDGSVVRGPSTAAMVREIEQVDLERLPEPERAVLRLLLDWGRRASAAAGALRIGISGPG